MSKHTFKTVAFCAFATSVLAGPSACSSSDACSGPNGLCISPPSAVDESGSGGSSVGGAPLGNVDAGAPGQAGAQASGGELEPGPVSEGGAAGIGTITLPGLGGGLGTAGGGGVGGAMAGVGGFGKGGAFASGGTGLTGAGGVGTPSGGGPPVYGGWGMLCRSAADFPNTGGTAGVPGTEPGVGAGGAGPAEGGAATRDDSSTSPGGDTGVGAAGAPSVVPPVLCAVPDSHTAVVGDFGQVFPIDNFDNGSGQQSTLDGYLTWFSAASDGYFFPSPFTSSDSQDGHGRALHVYGAGFASNGYAQVGNFMWRNGTDCLYPLDVSGIAGIQFSARASLPTNGASPLLRVSVHTVATSPPSGLGTCTDKCNDAHGAYVAINDQWNTYVVPLVGLQQEGWGTPVTFDPSQVLGINWTAKAESQYGEQAACFDYWLDDIVFVHD